MKLKFKFELDTSRIDKVIEEAKNFTEEEIKIFKDGCKDDTFFLFAVGSTYRLEADGTHTTVYEPYITKTLQDRLDKIKQIRKEEFIKENEEKFLEFVKSRKTL